jgi:hypothetical protein
MDAPRSPATRFSAIGANLSAVAVVVLMAAGCADLRWQKPGGSDAALEEDLAECRSQARLRTSRFSNPFATDWPRVVGADALGRPVVSPFSRLDSDSFLVEHDLTRQCMNGKGYDLVPARNGER